MLLVIAILLGIIALTLIVQTTILWQTVTRLRRAVEPGWRFMTSVGGIIQIVYDLAQGFFKK